MTTFTMPPRGQADPDTATDHEHVVADVAWPTLANDACYGLVGDVVHSLDPYTEADPAAVLFGFLAFAGNYFDTRPHLRGGNTEHPGRVWPLITGATSSGAKGTAMSVVQQLMRAIDKMYTVANRASGLSSSEGLIRRVRDPNGDDPDAKDFDEGVADKRLIIWEPEFVNVLSRARREGNSLSGTIRDAYDGVPLQTLVSHSPLFASNHHITIVGAITPQELVAKLAATDITNGFANRFMIVCSRRSKLLPNGGDPPYPVLADLANRFHEAATLTRDVAQMQRSDAAAQLWDAEYRARFSAPLDESPTATMLARWHAHSTRMSVIYALLDGCAEVREKHVRASLAAWNYVEQSVQYVFGAEKADPDLGRLAEFVDNAELGVTRSEISKELFRRNKPRAELDALCRKLLALGRYEVVLVPTDGRPKRVYVRRGRRSGP